MAVEEYPTQPETRSAWQDYGPTILGAVVVLAILVGGWYFWRLRTQSVQEPQEVAQVEQVEEQEASPSPTPSPEQEAQAAEAPEIEATMPKGGPEELPATGFPQAALAVTSLLALAAGWKLRRIR